MQGTKVPEALSLIMQGIPAELFLLHKKTAGRRFQYEKILIRRAVWRPVLFSLISSGLRQWLQRGW